jgi:beta-phosphoglucomutase-like phosphatase (HAD superfamily)
MGAAPARCVVVEDTPTGTRAGIAAGMVVLAFVGAPHADRRGLEAAGALLFERMADLPGLLG